MNHSYPLVILWKEGSYSTQMFYSMNVAKNKYFEKFNYFDNGRIVKRTQSNKIWIEKKLCFAGICDYRPAASYFWYFDSEN